MKINLQPKIHSQVALILVVCSNFNLSVLKIILADEAKNRHHNYNVQN